jgi:hypothetical protein
MIARRSRLGMTVSIVGIAVLAGGMIASFRPQLIWASMLALVLGFVLAQIGSYNLRRWGRSPRPDQVLQEAMKGFDDRFHFYAWSLPAPYVLLSPQGLYAFVTKDQSGQVSVNGKTWKTRFNLGRALLMFAQEGMGNPSDEAEITAKKLNDWLHTKLPESTTTVQPVIVFIDPKVELNATEPTVPVLEPKAMKKWLRGSGKGDNIKMVEYKALETVLDEAAGA